MSLSFLNLSSLFWCYYLIAVIALLGIYSVISSIRSYWRLRHFRGPPLAAWTELWLIRTMISGKPQILLCEALEKYGPLIRVGPNTLITRDEELTRKINLRRSGYHKSDWYKWFRFGAEKENLFSETDNDRHILLRKRFAPGYSGKENPRLESDMDSVILSLVRSWKERYISNGNVTKPMDFAEQTQYLMLDIITALYLGEPFGWVTSNSDLHAYLETMLKN